MKTGIGLGMRLTKAAIQAGCGMILPTRLRLSAPIIAPFDSLVIRADRAVQRLKADELVNAGQGFSQGSDPPEVLLLCD